MIEGMVDQISIRKANFQDAGSIGLLFHLHNSYLSFEKWGGVARLEKSLKTGDIGEFLVASHPEDGIVGLVHLKRTNNPDEVAIDAFRPEPKKGSFRLARALIIEPNYRRTRLIYQFLSFVKKSPTLAGMKIYFPHTKKQTYRTVVQQKQRVHLAQSEKPTLRIKRK